MTEIYLHFLFAHYGLSGNAFVLPRRPVTDATPCAQTVPGPVQVWRAAVCGPAGDMHRGRRDHEPAGLPKRTGTHSQLLQRRQSRYALCVCFLLNILQINEVEHGVGLLLKWKLYLLRRYFWTTLILNFSQMWALYCLAYFYVVTKRILRPISPLGKFMCIKLVVFFTFWQTLGFTILGYADMLPEWTTSVFHSEATGGEDFHVLESNAIQGSMICAEMFLFAIAHRFVFSWKDYVSEGGAIEKKSRMDAFKSIWMNGDLMDEFAFVVKTESNTLQVHH